MPGSPDNLDSLSQMSRPIKLRHPPRFTADIVDDARERILQIAEDLARFTAEYSDDIEVWGSAVTTAGWEIASLGQWLGLEGEAVLLLGGASYPEIAEHQGTSQSNVYNRVGKSLTLAPYARQVGAATRVSNDALQDARAEYAAEDPTEAVTGDGSPEGSLAERIQIALRGGALRTTEIIAALEATGADYRRSSILSTLSILAKQGTVVRTGHGVYGLPPRP